MCQVGKPDTSSKLHSPSIGMNVCCSTYDDGR